MLTLTGSLPANADGGTIFSEDWETGDDGWTTTGEGASYLCEPIRSCRLHLDPPCCSSFVDVTHELDVPLEGRMAFSFDFGAVSNVGDTDSNFYLAMDANGQIVYATTEWFNNGLSLLVTGDGEDRNFASYDALDGPMTLRLLIEGDTNQVQAQMMENGSVVGASRVLSFTPEATSIVAVGMNAVYWGGVRASFEYDNLVLAPSTDCFAPSATIDAPWTAHVGADVPIGLDAGAAEDCGPLTWSLDFGDGNTTGGTGAPPSTVLHNYSHSGYYTLAFRVDRLNDESSATATSVLEIYQPGPSTHTRTYDGTIILASHVAGNWGEYDGWLFADSGNLTWSYETLADAEVDLVFYGYFSDLASCHTNTCEVPPGAIGFRLDGVGALVTWHAEHTWTTWRN